MSVCVRTGMGLESKSLLIKQLLTNQNNNPIRLGTCWYLISSSHSSLLYLFYQSPYKSVCQSGLSFNFKSPPLSHTYQLFVYVSLNPSIPIPNHYHSHWTVVFTYYISPHSPNAMLNINSQISLSPLHSSTWISSCFVVFVFSLPLSPFHLSQMVNEAIKKNIYQFPLLYLGREKFVFHPVDTQACVLGETVTLWTLAPTP